MNNKNEKNLFRFLLIVAKSRNKLQDIAKSCGVARISLSEFIRSGYLGKDKYQKIKNWIVKNNYLPNSVDEQEYYILLQFFLINTFNELSKIPFCEPLKYINEKDIKDIEEKDIKDIKDIEEKFIHQLPSSKEIVTKQKSIEFDQLKVLYKCIHKSFQNIEIKDEQKLWGDIEKNIIEHSNFYIPDQNYLSYLIHTVKIKKVDNPLVDFNNLDFQPDFELIKWKPIQPNEKELAIRFVRQKKLIDEKISELNKAIPPITGPIVSCDYFCEKCNKWSPTTGKFCMHCGIKIKTEKLCEESFNSLPN